MKIEIKKWEAIGFWKWNIANNESVCGICRNAFEATCPNCKTPGDECPLMWGECRHVFHLHCILKWIGSSSSKGTCPMDRLEWKTATSD